MVKLVKVTIYQQNLTIKQLLNYSKKVKIESSYLYTKDRIGKDL